MEDILRELNALKDEFERYKTYVDELLLNLDSDNIVEIDFGRTRLRNGKGAKAVATQEWVTDNFEAK